jgi:hypothetical protein
MPQRGIAISMIRMKLADCQLGVPQLARAIVHFLPFIRDKIPDSARGVFEMYTSVIYFRIWRFACFDGT